MTKKKDILIRKLTGFLSFYKNLRLTTDTIQAVSENQVVLKLPSNVGYEDDSVCKVTAVQAWGPELGPWNPCLKAGDGWGLRHAVLRGILSSRSGTKTDFQIQKKRLWN